ncbi:MAG: AAA family ATPase [Acidimicrobiia bacterium]|nr:AAA family ATPase [Acidimicrobiia bacterium]
MVNTRLVVVTGAGGVGKTTISAAVGIRAAKMGWRTLVVTVDPARRLADALGTQLGPKPSIDPNEPNLGAAMIDAAGSWRIVAQRHADPEVADRLIANEFFVAATSQFPASQSYAAADEAAGFVQSGEWDLVVVDTPPSAGGIEFFTAPAQMTDLVGGRLLRFLTGSRLPGRNFFFRAAARPALRIADSILGAHLLERVAQFLMDLRTTYDGVAARAQTIERLFATATILVVATSDAGPMGEAARFLEHLPSVAGEPTAVVFNRSLPEEWIGVASPTDTDPTLAANLDSWSTESERQRDLRTAFLRHHRVDTISIPLLGTPPTGLTSLSAMIPDHLMATMNIDDRPSKAQH